MKIFITRWLPLFLWLALIYYLSSRPAMTGSSIDWLDFVMKKTAHISEYAILTFLAFRAFNRPFPDYAILLALFYAFTDETHQFFTPGRGAKLSDVGIDSVGITLMGYLIATQYEKIRLKLQRRHH